MALTQVKTTAGWVEGLPASNQMFTIFRGVPFAEPPVGKLRWKDSQPVKPWTGIRPCYKFGPKAMQEDMASEGGSIISAEYYVGNYEKSEDCLYLNIWTPAERPNKKLPVAVYIHGGGHQTGYSYLNCYDGEGFCKRGVIMVSIAYRLNVFGYLAHPELSLEQKGTSGNYGVKDQIAALTWIKENIAAFGGDPNCITVFGQSGGASSVANLCVLPKAKGLFQRAIMQSGGGIRNVYSYWSSSLARSEEVGSHFLKLLEVSSVEEARELPAEYILKAYTHFKQIKISEHDTPSLMGGYMRFSPVDDGVLFPEPVVDLYKKGCYPEIDYMLGSTSDEFTEITVNNLAFAENNSHLNRKPCYMYYFTHIPPGATHAHHSVEHHYVFQTLNRSYRPYTGNDWELSNELADYWANFMKTGNPNYSGKEQWKPYEGGSLSVFEIGSDKREMMTLSDEALDKEIKKVLE